MKKNKKKVEITSEIINYFREKVKNLLTPFRNLSPELGGAGDYLTEEIANEWFDEDIIFLEELRSTNSLILNIIKLYKEINNNFFLASEGNLNYDSTIWTAEGFEHHPFWENQRILAKHLLDELDKIQL